MQDEEMHSQRQEALAFVGGNCKGAQTNWTTFEKEAFSIYGVFKKAVIYVHNRRQVFAF